MEKHAGSKSGNEYIKAVCYHPTKPLATVHVSIYIWPSLSHKTFPKYWEIDKNVFFVQHIQHPTKSFSQSWKMNKKEKVEKKYFDF